MKWQAFYYTEADDDITSAKKWYKQQQPGLEKRFANDVKRSLSYILNDPLLYEVKYKSVRVAYLEVFPYGIHFYINHDAKQIIIVGILHQHRNPEVGFNR